MADTKKPFEEVSAEDAQAMFANAAKALGGSQGRSAGFRRVSIPVSEPVRPSRISSEDEYDDYDERYDFGATTVIPGAVVFDYYDDYDEEYDEYFCMMDLDEDEVYRIMPSRNHHCPFYRQGDDYTLARRQ